MFQYFENVLLELLGWINSVSGGNEFVAVATFIRSGVNS